MSVEMAVSCIIGFSHGLKKSENHVLFASLLGVMLSFEIHFKICYREEFEQFKIHRMDFSLTCYFWVANWLPSDHHVLNTWLKPTVHLSARKTAILADIWNQCL